ncbi:MalY/PatB family protein [Clostridium thailandense]|uniref:Pyridoxal phosphate-dependent aminotransferase n=1 Tax=Clostridium thailandense TaxID=2794346 RepID=A0A949TJZ8_9CLOT|nr:MalY/PatB family protein [Clostridium thailandense]MBV7273705.1 pyridoxal phosphate-dependent aminotransferase [Clostridium thailandense]MCH5137097.1 pyridoxal phosphate-dependent aminotransferase [Clostridiaceae bacterium UIB06]
MYDFNTIFSRRNVGAAKWDSITQEMGVAGEDIIPLSVADMEFKVAPEIVTAIKKVADFAAYGYTIPTESYYEAVIGWMERRHNWKIKKEWISLSTGVVPAFNTAIRAFTHPGDKVIIQQPVYYPFGKAITNNGCQVVNNALIYKGGNYTIDFDDLEEKVKDPLVKILLFCNPHNPVGRVWTEEELNRVGEICLKAGVLVISDEIHFDFVFKPYKHKVFATLSQEFQDNSLILTAPSKTFNLAGLQCSNVIIPNSKLKAQFDNANERTGFFSLNHFAYAACEAAYNEGELWLDELLEYLEGNLNYLKSFMAKELPQVKVIETEGTYLVWLDCKALGLTNSELEKLMKEKARIFLDEGYIFGASGAGFERVNIACPRAMLEKALNNMKNAIKSII